MANKTKPSCDDLTDSVPIEYQAPEDPMLHMLRSELHAAVEDYAAAMAAIRAAERRYKRARQALQAYEEARLLAAHPEWLRRDRTGPQRKHATHVAAEAGDRARAIEMDTIEPDLMRRAFHRPTTEVESIAGDVVLDAPDD
jgi:hypothetical protein